MYLEGEGAMMTGRNIFKVPCKGRILFEQQVREAVRKIANAATMKADKYIKIGRVSTMEVRIHIDVEKVDNGFILFRDIHGIKLREKLGEERREVYVTFPEVRARIIELLKRIAGEFEEDIAEAIPEKK